MPSQQYAPISPNVLHWALLDSGWQIEEVAKKITVKPEKIISWESGKKLPTFKQVQKLAKVLHRPLSIFFQKMPPVTIPLAAEYRRLPNVSVGQESPHLRLSLRQMIRRRELAIELMEELNINPIPFQAVAHLHEKPEIVGERIRSLLGISIEEQFKWTNEWSAWRSWRHSLEAIGVLVFQFGKVDLQEVRGTTLFHNPLPVIGINSKEAHPGAKVFTLLHELAHLMLANGNEEKAAINENRSIDEWMLLESFAEKVASHAMIPELYLNRAIDDLSIGLNDWTLSNTKKLAKRFSATPLATATRLRESGLMSWDQYNAWRAEWKDYVAAIPKQSGGFALPADKTLGKVGRPFTQLVLEALSSNKITSVDASRYLDLKFDRIESLKGLISGPTRAGNGN